MRTLGLIGGTTWHSTIDYYRIINQQVSDRLGGHNSSRMLLYSVNFADFAAPANAAEWARIAENLSDIARRLEQAGAEGLILCANTMHMVADIVQQNIGIPLIHIATATAREIRARNIGKVGLLGTKFTMEADFFKDKLAEQEVQTLIPSLPDRAFIHQSIYNELGKGIFSDETRARYKDIIGRLIGEGAEGMILGCTEIPILIKQEDCAVPVFDTAFIHGSAAVEFSLSKGDL
jgi:aspartate racemase